MENNLNVNNNLNLENKNLSLVTSEKQNNFLETTFRKSY